MRRTLAKQIRKAARIYGIGHRQLKRAHRRQWQLPHIDDIAAMALEIQLAEAKVEPQRQKRAEYRERRKHARLAKLAAWDMGGRQGTKP